MESKLKINSVGHSRTVPYSVERAYEPEGCKRVSKAVVNVSEQGELVGIHCNSSTAGHQHSENSQICFYVKRTVSNFESR